MSSQKNSAFLNDQGKADESTEASTSSEAVKNVKSDDRKKSINIGTSTVPIIIESEPMPKNMDCWDKTCDVFGTRQAAFISHLRPIRPYLLRMQEALKIFQYELERDLKTSESSKATFQHIQKCVVEINHISMHGNLNIPPDEHAMLRSVAYELAVLARIVEEISKNVGRPVSSSHPTISATNFHTNRIEASDGSRKRDVGTGNNSSAAVDERSLKENIRKVFNIVENLIKYIDKKTQRRWWLRDVINFMQASVKVALFISAAISVAYHENQIAPIITLIITCIQGITEGFDQYFLKNKSPEDIHISILTSTMTNVKN